MSEYLKKQNPEKPECKNPDSRMIKILKGPNFFWEKCVQFP